MQTTQTFSETAKTLHTNATDLFIHSTRFVTLPKVKGLLLGKEKRRRNQWKDLQNNWTGVYQLKSLQQRKLKCEHCTQFAF